MSPILSLILDKLQSQTIITSFVIIYGPGADYLWPTIRESCQEATGFFSYHDVLDIRDYSKLIGSPHTLKIEYKKPTSDKNKFIEKTLHAQGYEDKGAREINDRLSYAPAGNMKILLIEHIDRATLSATNALLKSLEEPLPGRCIIASTINKDSILPTVLSRALLIHCDAAYTPMLLDDEGKILLSDMVDALDRRDIARLTKGSTKIAKSGYVLEFLDNLIYHYSLSHEYIHISSCIQTIRIINANVSKEHSLFYLFLEIIE